MTLSYFLTLFLATLGFGSIIGAYFTTADYRIRNNAALITSQCYCPMCQHPLALSHQIPVISWLVLRGRCHYCKSPISKHYPLTEGIFLFFYGITYLLFWTHPVILLCVWLGCILFILFVRCRRHYRSFLKGAAIFAGYHAVYGMVLLMIHAALQPI